MSTVVITTLAECEAVIERGLGTFVEVGEALTRIRDGHLYGSGTFDDYCRDRWSISRPRAYQLIAAAETATLVSTNVDTPALRTEAVARELAPLRSEPDALREAWTDAVEQHGPTPTAKQVRDVVEIHKPAPPRDVHAEFARTDPAVASAVAVRDSNEVLARVQSHIFELRHIDLAGCCAVLDSADRDRLKRLTEDCDRALGEIASLRDTASERLRPVRRVS